MMISCFQRKLLVEKRVILDDDAHNVVDRKSDLLLATLPPRPATIYADPDDDFSKLRPFKSEVNVSRSKSMLSPSEMARAENNTTSRPDRIVGRRQRVVTSISLNENLQNHGGHTKTLPTTVSRLKADSSVGRRQQAEQQHQRPAAYSAGQAGQRTTKDPSATSVWNGGRADFADGGNRTSSTGVNSYSMQGRSERLDSGGGGRVTAANNPIIGRSQQRAAAQGGGNGVGPMRRPKSVPPQFSNQILSGVSAPRTDAMIGSQYDLGNVRNRVQSYQTTLHHTHQPNSTGVESRDFLRQPLPGNQFYHADRLQQTQQRLVGAFFFHFANLFYFRPPTLLRGSRIGMWG